MDKPLPENGEEITPTPPLLYRYRPLPDEPLPTEGHKQQEEYKRLLGREERIFTKRELYFSSPAKFNDPFDCKAEMLRFSDDPILRRKESYQVLKAQNPGLSRQQLRGLLRQGEKEGIFNKLFNDKRLFEGIQETIDSLGVLCLSKTFNSILMWSHYTNGHKGYCLAFSPALILGPYKKNTVPMEIKYQEAHPSVTIYVESRNKQTDLALRTKAKQWRYEEEWRLVREAGAGDTVEYPEGALVGVILGCRISDRHKRLLIEWIEAMTPRPMIIQAQRKAKEYGLDLFLMNPETGKDVPVDLNDLQSI